MALLSWSPKEGSQIIPMGWDHRVGCKPLTVRVFSIQCVEREASTDPLPNPHQGKVQRVKVDWEANLPSGHS